MKTLQPQPVEPTAWRRWLIQGFELYKRHLFINSLLVFAYAAVFSVLFVLFPELGFFVLTLLFPLQLVALFMRNARASDHSSAALAMLRPLEAVHYKRLTLLAVVFTLLFSMITVALLLILNLLAGNGNGAPSAAEKVFDYLFIGDTYSFVFVYGVIFFSELITVIVLFLHLFDMWFVLPLMYFEGMGLRESVHLSRHAVAINRQAVGKTELLLALLVLLNTFITLGLFILILLPVAGAAVYVAYRDVFLGIKENATEKITSHKADFIPSFNR
jgi:hypothetical protein